MLAPSRAAVLLCALMLPLAGCIGKGDAPAGTVTPEVNETAEQNATLPDGRGESAGLLETNKTEEGVGGVEHLHDYWMGKDKVVLFNDMVGIGCPPCMPDGEGTDAKSVAYVKLGKLPEGEADMEMDALVYEGADRVELLFGTPIIFDSLTGADPLVAPHPSASNLFMQYRSAADSAWQPAVPVTYNTPMTIDVTPQMTDMPHSSHSLWVFRLTTDRPELQMEVPMTLTAYKGRDVVDWPGHPDFYAETSERKVMDQHVTTHMSGIESFALYDSGGTWGNPEKLISWGTKEIHVIVNVTSTTNAYGASPTGYFLEVHNATVIGPEITFGSRHHEINGNNDLQTYEFAILVDEIGMDGPYQPGSRWGFRLMATFADVDGVVGFCPGCFPYDIEYDIVVIAKSTESGVGEVMD